MNPLQKRLPPKIGKLPTLLVLSGLIFGLALGLVAGYRLVTGRSLGIIGFIKDKVYTVTNYSRVIFDSQAVKNSGDGFDNIIFLHHSTGANLIEQGRVRALLEAQGLQLWDHGYNEIGLRGPDGKRREYHYSVPDDDTNPRGFHRIFQQPEYGLPLNTFSGLLQHDVIVFKSCFRPTNHIRSEEQLAQYQAWYLDIRAEAGNQPEKLFVIVTPPPLNPAETNPEEAQRARRFANWLKSDEYLSGHPNLVVFDFFDLLAVSDPASPEYNMLRSDYREADDSHPNQLANETIGPLFAKFLIEAINIYRQTR